MFGGGFFWLYGLFFVEMILVLVAGVAVFVMLFMTGRRAHDPRGLLPPTAFALSVTFAGLMGHVLAWGIIATTLGVQAGSASSCSLSQTGMLRGGSSAEIQLPPQPAPPQPAPPEIFLPDGPDGSAAPLVLCTSDTARRVASMFPYLISSGAALGGGSRMFRRLLNEERTHDPA